MTCDIEKVILRMICDLYPKNVLSGEHTFMRRGMRRRRIIGGEEGSGEGGSRVAIEKV